jgi:hypothetical protein
VKRRTGSALATVLLASLALFTLLKVLIIVSHSSGYRSRTYQDRVLAGYALEAGVADAIWQLNKSSGWVAGFDHERMPSAEGWYSVQFVPAGSTPRPLQSVNNMLGTTPADGPRGPATVPPGTADIVVRAGNGAIERRCLVHLTGKASQSFSTGLLSSNRILMSGDVDVSGITDLESGQAVNADLHSNKAGSAHDVIQWDGSGACNIQGTVSATSNASAAIRMTGANVAGGTRVAVAAKPAPSVDIPGLIAANSGQAALAIPPVGSVSVPAGTYYVDGDLTLDGDMLLDGAEIYVSGNVRVNGSLGGSGKIYAKGSTRLQGDTQISGAQGLALYSQGSVELTGFDGTEYLEAVERSDPAVATLLPELRTLLQEGQAILQSVTPEDLKEGAPRHNEFCDALGKLGGAYGGKNVAGQLAAALEAQPPGRTRDFMVGKMRDLEKLGADVDPNGDPVPHWQAGDHQHTGIMDRAMHSGDEALLQELMAVMGQYDVNKLGSTYFQGTIYTNGYIYAGQDVTLIGAVVANDNGTQAPAVVDTQIVEPGDIVLKRKVQFTLNQQAAEALGGPGPAPTAGQVRVKSWLEL